MKIFEVTTSINPIDNVNGWGNVPYNQNVNYMGLRVNMTPTIFANLAAPLSEPTSAKSIQNHLQNGGKIGAPFLIIDTPIEWSNGDFSLAAKVRSHEGRNRMIAIKNLYGDIPIETHLFFQGGISRNRHLNDEIINNLQNQMYKEKSNQLIKTKLFEL